MKEQIIISPIQMAGKAEHFSVVSCVEYPYGVVVPSAEVGTFVFNILDMRTHEKS